MDRRTLVDSVDEQFSIAQQCALLGLLTILTHREKQVLELLARGKEYNEIAHELQVSINGVRAHIKNVYRKLGDKNGVQAARFYWEDQFSRSLREQILKNINMVSLIDR